MLLNVGSSHLDAWDAELCQHTPRAIEAAEPFAGERLREDSRAAAAKSTDGCVSSRLTTTRPPPPPHSVVCVRDNPDVTRGYSAEWSPRR